MKYGFPLIDHIDDIRPAIEGREEFVVAEREGYVVVNYLVNFIDTFPPLTEDDREANLHSMLRRECRGIKFYSNGDIAARPFHKFFNMDERDETAMTVLPWGNEIWMNKMDGSMVHPFMLDDELHFMTKMGITDIAQGAFAHARVSDRMKETKYLEFCRGMINQGMTPIFEWCSRRQRIVVDYPEDSLVLLSCRNNVTGDYLTYENLTRLAEGYNIPVVQTYPVTAIEHIRESITSEGAVLQFDGGHMVKIKSEWYLKLHKTKENIQHEKNVIALCLENHEDDLLPFLLPGDKDRVIKFSNELRHGIQETATLLESIVTEFKDQNPDLEYRDMKKAFAKFVSKGHPKLMNFLFGVIDGKDAHKLITETVLENTNTQTRVDAYRFLHGAHWNPPTWENEDA